MKKMSFICLCFVLLVSCNKEEQRFDEFLQGSIEEMDIIISRSEKMCKQNVYAWREMGFRDDDRVSSFLAKYYDEKHDIDSLEAHSKRLSIYTSQLDNSLESRKECYGDYMKMFEYTVEYARLAKNIGGTPSTYMTSCAAIASKLKTDEKKFKEKYKSFLK